MSIISLHRRSARLTAVTLGLAGTALLGLTGATSAGAAAAQSGPVVVVHYDENGSTHVARPDIDIPLGRSTLVGRVQGTGDFTADLPLPTKHVSFLAFGYLPITADVVFTQVEPITGRLSTNHTGRSQITAVARYVVTLRDVVIGGAAAKVGSHCQTVYPVVLRVRTPADEGFNIINGGNITGTYRIGNFQDCGTSTDLTNIIVPGGMNTVTLTLSNGH